MILLSTHLFSHWSIPLSFPFIPTFFDQCALRNSLADLPYSSKQLLVANINELLKQIKTKTPLASPSLYNVMPSNWFLFGATHLQFLHLFSPGPFKFLSSNKEIRLKKGLRFLFRMFLTSKYGNNFLEISCKIFSLAGFCSQYYTFAS